MRAIASALPLLLAAASLAGCASAAASPASSSYAAPYEAPCAAPAASPDALSWTAPPPLAFAPPIQDAPGKEFDRSGLYAGLYAIQSYEDFDTGGGGVSTGDSDLGAGVKFGIRFGHFLAIEAIAENVTGFEVESGNVENDLDLTNYGVQGKLYPLGGRVQPYGLLGFGIASADVDNFNLDDDGGYIRLGLGADVYLTESLAIFGEINHNEGTGGAEDLNHMDVQLGLMLRF